MKIFKSMRPSEKLAATIALIVFIVSGSTLYVSAKHTYGTEIPVRGGSLTEGVVGYARFINPILAFTDTDKDLTALIYSGLLKATPEGNLIPDIAESVTVAPDGLSYNVILKQGLVFHDGTPITSDDVEFTILRSIDPLTKSVKAANWAGVTVEKVSPYEIRFTLKKPYAPFEENLTMGILPKHIWQEVSPEAFDVSTYNRQPIGSGPYRIKSTKQNATGLYEYYELEPFEQYALGTPFIQKITVMFFTNEQNAVNAFLNGDIDMLGGISPLHADRIIKNEDADHVVKNALPRVFGIFFNQNTEPVLINKEVRKALNDSIDKDAMITEILKGYGVKANSPIPESFSHLARLPASVASSSSAGPSEIEISADTASSTALDYIGKGRKILEDAGWKLGTSSDSVYEKKGKDKTEKLAFTLTTSNSPELKLAADILQKQWTKLGAEVKIEIFESSDLTQKVIRPRKYGALLFGQIIGRDLDLYPFWHSSQRVDPGLNIALYANIKADKALETARGASDTQARMTARADFEHEIANDIPAIFLFSPEFVYLSNRNIHNFDISSMTEPTDRFMNIHKWYMETDYTWKKSAKK